MRILDIYKNNNSRYQIVNINKSKIIMLRYNITLLEQGYICYDKLFIYDVNSHSIFDCPIKETLSDFLKGINKSYSVFLTFTMVEDYYYVNFYKLSLGENYSFTFVCKVLLGSKSIFKNNIRNFIYLFRMINDRYCIFLYNVDGDKYNNCIYDKAIVIDLSINDSYSCDLSTQNNKPLLKVISNSFMPVKFGYKNGFVVKTGSIGIKEKYEYFADSTFDFNEDLLVYENDFFIRSIIKGSDSNSLLVDSVDKDSHIDLIMTANDNIIYNVFHYKENCTKLISYNISDEVKDIINIEKDIFDYIEYYSYKEDIYGIYFKNNELVIRNILTSEEHCYEYNSAPPRVRFFNGKDLVLEVFENMLSSSVIIIDIKDNKLIQEFNNRKASYLTETDTLLLH